MDLLPAELLQLICFFLNPVPDLLRLQQVNRRWAAQCALPSLWRDVRVPPLCFPASFTRRASWNKFAKRLGKDLQALHLTLPLTLRLSDHRHPVTRASIAAVGGSCSICHSDLGEQFYICKIPSCAWSECVTCRLDSSMLFSLAPLCALHTLSFDRDGPWCWRQTGSGLSLQEKALRTVRTGKLKTLRMVGVPLTGHCGIEKWFVRHRTLERLSLSVASGCVLDLCTVFWTSLKELTLFATDSVAWNIIGVMHLISVDCPALEQLSISFASAGTFPIYNISPLVHMRRLHLASRTDCLDIDEETLSYLLRSLNMVNLDTLELEGMIALSNDSVTDQLLERHPNLKSFSLKCKRVKRTQLMSVLTRSRVLESLSLTSATSEPFTAVDVALPPRDDELHLLSLSALKFVRLCTPLTERTVCTLALLPKLEELELYSPGWLRARVNSICDADAAFPSLARFQIDAESLPNRLHVSAYLRQSDEFLASILPLMRRLTRLQLRSFLGLTGAGWRNNLHATNPLLVTIETSVKPETSLFQMCAIPQSGTQAPVLPLKRKDASRADDAFMDTSSVG